MVEPSLAAAMVRMAQNALVKTVTARETGSENAWVCAQPHGSIDSVKRSADRGHTGRGMLIHYMATALSVADEGEYQITCGLRTIGVSIVGDVELEEGIPFAISDQERISAYHYLREVTGNAKDCNQNLLDASAEKGSDSADGILCESEGGASLTEYFAITGHGEPDTERAKIEACASPVSSVTSTVCASDDSSNETAFAIGGLITEAFEPHHDAAVA